MTQKQIQEIEEQLYFESICKEEEEIQHQIEEQEQENDNN